MTLEDLGCNSTFQAARQQLGLEDSPLARVIAEFKGAYRVKDPEGEYLAKVTGKQMFEASSREDYPAVGDWAVIEKLDHANAVIRGLLPRQTAIRRIYKDKIQVIGANIDVAFVVEAADRDYNLNRLERYFAIAESGGVRPAIILNKIDLLSENETQEKLLELQNRFPGADMIFASTVSGKSLDDLKNYIEPGKTYCFLGSSGVGKSSLINALLGTDNIKTGKISAHTGKGMHVTTARQMYFLPARPGLGREENSGGIVIDNPGMREVGVAEASRGIDTHFEEIVALAKGCKYADCTHIREPGCAVLQRVRSGKLDEEKYSNYLSLKQEAEFHELSELEKREKDRKFGKSIKSAKKELKRSDARGKIL